jgi:DNA-binding MarR family transcriptional regulator
MKQEYLSMLLLIERLHRRFLDVVKAEIDRMGVEDINNVQTLILYNIGDASLTIGELTNRGYYLGSNVSYNIKKLVESDYLVQERSAHDKRAVKVQLSEKGLTLIENIDKMYQGNVDQLQELGLDEKEVADAITTLRKVENFWTNSINNIQPF